MSRPGWRRSGQLTRGRPLVLGMYDCSDSCWWYARIHSRLVQAGTGAGAGAGDGGGGGATHECGSGDLLDTGSAHALARRRGEGTTSQHFEVCVYMRVGEGMGGGGGVAGVDLQQQKQQSPSKSSQRSAASLATSNFPREVAGLPRLLAGFVRRVRLNCEHSSSVFLYQNTLPRRSDSCSNIVLRRLSYACTVLVQRCSRFYITRPPLSSHCG